MATKKDIKEAAKKLFAEKGVDSISINDIVSEAGIAKGTFYNYYKSKNELIDDVFTEISEKIIADIPVFSTNKQAEEITIDSVLEVIDYVFLEAKKNISFLKIMKNDLSYEENFNYKKHFVEALKAKFNEILKLSPCLHEEEISIEIAIYIIVDMVINTCYNSIVLKRPYKEEEAVIVLKNLLKKIIG